MKKICISLAALLILMAGMPALAEDTSAEMAELLLGDWVHQESSAYSLWFDGVDKFFYSADTDDYYGIYSYKGDGEYRLINDEGDARILSIYDDTTLALEGIENYFHCNYAYWLMDFPNADGGAWPNDDGQTALFFELEGGFEFESENAFLYGEYAYQGDGDFLLHDDEGNSHIVSRYTDGSISMEGIDGYFWLQPEPSGDDPFEYVKEDAEFFAELLACLYENDPIPLSGAWYKNGDPNATPFILEGNAYRCENNVFSHEIESGTWTLDETVRALNYENTAAAPYICMETNEGMPSSWNPVTMAGNRCCSPMRRTLTSCMNL